MTKAKLPRTCSRHSKALSNTSEERVLGASNVLHTGAQHKGKCSHAYLWPAPWSDIGTPLARADVRSQHKNQTHRLSSWSANWCIQRTRAAASRQIKMALGASQWHQVALTCKSQAAMLRRWAQLGAGLAGMLQATQTRRATFCTFLCPSSSSWSLCNSCVQVCGLYHANLWYLGSS